MKGQKIFTVDDCLKLHKEGIAVILMDGRIQGFEKEPTAIESEGRKQ